MKNGPASATASVNLATIKQCCSRCLISLVRAPHQQSLSLLVPYTAPMFQQSILWIFIRQ